MEIICSIGPKINSIEDIEVYINNGMTIPRFNFSHVDYNKFNNLIAGIKNKHKNLKVLQDLQGNKIRVSKLFNTEMRVANGDKVIFCLEKDYYKLRFNKKYKVIPISYEGILKDFRNVQVLYMKDATMKFNIKNKGALYIYAVTERGGIIRSEKGINAPQLDRSNLMLTKKDMEDIKWGIERRVDIICLSFVTSAKDMKDLKMYINKYANNPNIKLWAKIECMEGYNNFEEILNVSDGIMLGRGDFKGECYYPDIPYMQQKIIKRMKTCEKPLIIATYILDSMKRGETASLAELNDIYNFVKYDVNGLMLSNELTISKYPEYIIRFLDSVIKRYEGKLAET